GLLGPLGVPELAAAFPAVRTAEAAMNQRLDAAFEFACAPLPAPVITRLAAIRANRVWEVPAPYQVVDRSPEQWLALRNALAAQRIQASRQQEVPGTVTSILTQAASHPAVESARLDFNMNLPAVRSTWQSYFGVR
ncbi:MAG: hypothetical protein KIT68_13505, partial [Phycisphaeraceae bacterium]|nr:hypothetical protein [Phycisphaeraceae bacterium]